MIIGLDILCQVYSNDIQCGEKLQNKEKEQVIELVNKHANCFANTLDKIDKYSVMKMNISVSSNKPIAKNSMHCPFPNNFLIYLIDHNNSFNGFRPAATDPSRRLCFLRAYASWSH